MNTLLDETKTKKLELGLPWLREIRMSPGLQTILIEEKPENMTWPEYATAGMLMLAFIARILRFDLRGVIALGVRLTGWVPDGVALVPTPVGSADNGRVAPSKPPMPARKAG